MLHPGRDRLWRYAAVGLSVEARRGVRRHARDCQACRVELERAIVAQRCLRLDADPAAPSTMELRAWRDDILQRAAQAEAEGGWRRGGASLRWLLVPLLAVAAVVAGLLLPGTGNLPSPADTLVARGAAAAPGVYVRVLCVVAGNGEAEVIDPQGHGDACPAGSYLKVLVGRATSLRQRLLVLTAEDGQVSWLYPAASDQQTLRLPEAMTPLPGSLALDRSMHGPVRVIALALDDVRVDGEDALLRWAAQAIGGSYADVLGRADAVVLEVEVIQ